MNLLKIELKTLINNRFSIGDIAKKLNKGKSTIRYYLKKYKLKTNPIHKSGPKTSKNGMKQRNWEEIQNFYNANNSWKDVCKHFKISEPTICKAVKLNILKSRNWKDSIKIGAKKNIGKKLTTKQKEHLSFIKKEFYRLNPDKHPWRNHHKFKSVPCEKFKDWLRLKNIYFIEEFNPNITNRNFSIDIVFPDKMIGLEINGNQHYNKDGTLKYYYQERQNLIEKEGWKLIQIHYSICFNVEKIENLINIIF